MPTCAGPFFLVSASRSIRHRGHEKPWLPGCGRVTRRRLHRLANGVVDGRLDPVTGQEGVDAREFADSRRHHHPCHGQDDDRAGAGVQGLAETMTPIIWKTGRRSEATDRHSTNIPVQQHFSAQMGRDDSGGFTDVAPVRQDHHEPATARRPGERERDRDIPRLSSYAEKRSGFHSAADACYCRKAVSADHKRR
jgi:hypothetical protein